MSEKEKYPLDEICINPVVNGYKITYAYKEDEYDYDGYQNVFVCNTWKEVVNHLSNNPMGVKNER